jgi:hypothetical protein
MSGGDFVRNQGEANEVMNFYKRRKKGGNIRAVNLEIAFAVETIQKGTSVNSEKKVAKDSSWKMGIGARFSSAVRTLIKLPGVISGECAAAGSADAGYAKEASTSSVTITKQTATFEDGGMRSTPVFRLDINYVKNKMAPNAVYTRYRVASGFSSEEKVTLAEYFNGRGQVSGDFLRSYNEKHKMDLFCHLILQPSGSTHGEVVARTADNGKILHLVTTDASGTRKHAGATSDRYDLPLATGSRYKSAEVSRQRRFPAPMPTQNRSQLERTRILIGPFKIISWSCEQPKTERALPMKAVQLGAGAISDRVTELPVEEVPPKQVHSVVPPTTSWSPWTKFSFGMLFIVLVASWIFFYRYTQTEQNLPMRSAQRRQWSGLNFFGVN